MTGSAPSGVGRPEADEKATQDDRDKSFERKQRGPREYLARREAGEVVNAQIRQSESGLFRDMDVVRFPPLRSEPATQSNTRHEKKIPKTGSPPVVTKI